MTRSYLMQLLMAVFLLGKLAKHCREILDMLGFNPTHVQSNTNIMNNLNVHVTLAQGPLDIKVLKTYIMSIHASIMLHL